MTSTGRARFGCDAVKTRWRTTEPPVSISKRIGGVPHPWPPLPLPQPTGGGLRTLGPPPAPLFHTRHAEQSAERPRLITVVRPCGQSVLRKVTVLLNRRGVVSYEQLLMDLSEALGFPHWHRARVTRLYTPHAREVKGVCDFFRGEAAFLAFGKSRPELLSVDEALEELFPEPSGYRADALRAWEKRLLPKPDKATKADSGFSEGTDSSDAHAQQSHRAHLDADTHMRTPHHTHRPTQAPHLTDSHKHAKHHSDTHKHHKTHGKGHPTHPPNHLQKLRVKGRARETPLSVISPFIQEEGLRKEIDKPFPTLCGNCKALEKGSQERTNHRSGRIPLPPVTRKQKGNIAKEQEARLVSNSCPHPTPISKASEKSSGLSELFSSNTPQEVEHQEVHEPSVTFDLPSEGSDVTLSDIERYYDIGRVVGDGNFAVVHECCRRDNGETLAMKIVERSKLIGREHMMQNELSLLGSLSHPRVVRLFTYYHTHTHSYLIMELVAGGDLFDAIAERGKFPEKVARLMVSDISEALRYIHSKRIVHRDLKPENLLVESPGVGSCRLKLGDFGLAMVVTEPIFTICGTPTYVAPEILSETGYGLAVDVWALGVIFYILLCGFPPFRSRDRDQEELFQLIKQGELHFLSPYWDSISEGATSLVRALLQVDPTERLLTAQILQHPWVLNAATTGSIQQGALPHTSQTSTDQMTELQTMVDQTKLAEARKALNGSQETSTYQHNHEKPSTVTSVDPNHPTSAPPQYNSNIDNHNTLNPTLTEPNPEHKLVPTNIHSSAFLPNSLTQPLNTVTAPPTNKQTVPQATTLPNNHPATPSPQTLFRPQAPQPSSFIDTPSE